LSLRLHKLSGAGNDFLAWVEPEREPEPAEVVAWCARALGLGADGLFTLRQVADGRVRMAHWNADGGRAELCLNGTRCAARLAFELGWAQREVVLDTDAGALVGRRTAVATEISVDVDPPAAPPVAQVLRVGALEVSGWYVRVGVPHLVVPWASSLASAPVAELGPPLRRHAALGEAGANVNFVRYLAPERFEIRTFERGVEGETLACGTGVLAAAAVGLALGHTRLPARAQTAGGFVLTVAGEARRGVARAWSLVGDARWVGTVEPRPEAALPAPSPPRWSD